MLLYFLIDFQKTNPYPPRVSEIAAHFGVANGTAMGRLLTLEKKITSKYCGMRAGASAGSV